MHSEYVAEYGFVDSLAEAQIYKLSYQFSSTCQQGNIIRKCTKKKNCKTSFNMLNVHDTKHDLRQWDNLPKCYFVVKEIYTSCN